MSEENQISTYEKQRLDYLKDKFGMNGLHLTDRPIEPRKKTLEDAVNESDNLDRVIKGAKLCKGSTQYKGSKLNIWFEVSK